MAQCGFVCRVGLAGAALLALSGGARAQLSWLKTEDTFTASATQDVYVAEYPFVNQGAAPVEIRDIKTTCGCTSAELAKRVYAPGESGELVVAFRLRGRRGAQDKRIRVRTDDPSSDVELRLAGTIKELAIVKPIFLLWRQNATPDWKSSTIKVREGAGMRIVSVAPSSETFEFRLEERTPGLEYELVVRPKTGTARQDLCVFELALAPVEQTAAAEQRVFVHARIK